jgi:hypothetical protein
MKKLVCCLLIAISTACSPALVGGAPDDTPEGVFEILWSDFDALYALFGIKDVDWDDTYQRRLREARAVEDDEELVDVLSATMGELDDDHLKLFDETGEQLWWNGEEAEEPFDEDTVRDLYLTEEFVDADRDGETQVLAGRIDDVGYLRIATWVGSGGVGTPGDWTQHVHDAIDRLGDSRALIIDVRSNGGGSFFNGLDVAGRFTAEPVPAFTTSFRNGPAHDDMSALETWTVEPREPLYVQPVYVLTDPHCYSANEAFVLMMRAVGGTIIGEPTGGAMGTQVRRELPNGWVFRVTVNDTRAPDGTSYEESGIPPDIEVVAGDGDDPVLDEALLLTRRSAM